MTEPGAKAVTATAAYGQYISTGYSYLTRTDGRAFLPGYWVATLEGTAAEGSHVAYSGVVVIVGPRPNMPKAASMMGQTITGSTGAKAVLGRP